MKLDYMECWNGAMALLGKHKEALLAIAGVFIFLPPVITAQFVGVPPIEGLTEPSAIQAAQLAFIAEHWPILVLSNFLTVFGGTALYILFSPSHKGTVADILSTALKLFIFFFLTSFLSGIATILGLLLLIIPGLYIMSRLSIASMFVTDQHERNPIEALKKSWNATKDNGFSILLFLFIIVLMGLITLLVAQLIIGLIVGLATGGTGWPLIENIFNSLFGSVFQIVLIAVIASLYRILTGQSDATNVEEIFS